MAITYPLQTATGGGGGDATSIGGVPVDISGLQSGHVIKYSSNENKWVNGNLSVPYFLSFLATPTSGSSTATQEITRVSAPFPSNQFAENSSLIANYSISSGYTGSIVISSSIGEISTLVSGTNSVQYKEVYMTITGSTPYHLFVSSSNSASDFKIYSLSFFIGF